MITKEDAERTTNFVKKKAKRLKKEHGVPHYVALDLACEALGFETWDEFLKAMRVKTA